MRIGPFHDKLRNAEGKMILPELGDIYIDEEQHCTVDHTTKSAFIRAYPEVTQNSLRVKIN